MTFTDLSGLIVACFCHHVNAAEAKMNGQLDRSTLPPHVRGNVDEPRVAGVVTADDDIVALTHGWPNRLKRLQPGQGRPSRNTCRGQDNATDAKEDSEQATPVPRRRRQVRRRLTTVKTSE